MVGEERRYNLKEKWWHPLVIKSFIQICTKHSSTCFCSHSRVWKGLQPSFQHTQQARQPWLHGEAEMCQSHGGHDRTVGWPACCSRATRSFPVAWRQLLPLGCQQQGCAGSRTASSHHAKRKWAGEVCWSLHCQVVMGSNCRHRAHPSPLGHKRGLDKAMSCPASEPYRTLLHLPALHEMGSALCGTQ